MSWSDYQTWINRGKPFRLMTPAANLRDRLRAHGYIVYDIGNESHMTHEPPEDHTPYSETSYPGKSVYGVGYAIDIMPPKAGQVSKIDGKPLPSLQKLGAQLVADRKAGVSGIKWLKYINWEPERDNGGACYHDSWQPTFVRRSSSDRGHIHCSGLTGYESSTVAAGYDPVQRIRGTGGRGRDMIGLKYGDGKDGGDIAEEVKGLQYSLEAAGFELGTPDGWYGDKTAAAVKACCGGPDGRLFVGIHFSRLLVQLAKKHGAGPGPKGDPGPAGPPGKDGAPGELTLPASLVFKGTLEQGS